MLKANISRIIAPPPPITSLRDAGNHIIWMSIGGSAVLVSLGMNTQLELLQP